MNLHPEEAAAKARARREANVPDPWFQRKAAVGIAVGGLKPLGVMVALLTICSLRLCSRSS